MGIGRPHQTNRITRSRHLGAGLLAFAVIVLTSAGGAPAGAARGAASPAQAPQVADPAQLLAERYRPVILTQEQTKPCGSGEPYIPMSVEAVLGNPEVALRQRGDGNPVVMWGPTAADLYDLGEGFFLDYPGDALDPGCLYEKDSRKYNADIGPTIYAHIVEHAAADRLVVEYWFFWYFNDWNNKHEGDWEGIQVVFPAPTIAEALDTEPIAVGYAQHEGGVGAAWDSDALEREGDNPVVYPSAGSHASYLGSSVFLGRGASEGFGCDDTGGPTTRLEPQVVVLPSAAAGPDDPFAWLNFRGQWGERHDGPYGGPTGPASKGRYLNPMPWQDDLRSSSVVVPAGDGQLSAIVNVFCSVVEFGSNQVIAFQLSPTRGLVTLGLLVFVAWFVLRRTVWRPGEPEPLLQHRRGGQVITAALRTLGRGWWLFLLIGLAAIPIGALAGTLIGLLRVVPLVGDIVELLSKDEGSQFFVSMLAGGATSVLAYVFIAAAAAWVTAEHAAERRPSAGEVLTAVLGRWRPLTGGFLRALAIVGALFLTVIGGPIAIVLLVRYQFLAQVVMLEDAPTGGEALRRSSSLVRGRWWRTGWMVLVVHLAATLTVTVIGLLLLVALDLPFWALSATLTIAQLLAIPLAAAAITFLYGDAAATEGATDPEPEPAAV